jgi:hypothetical protein
MAQTYANNDNVLSKVKFGNTTYYIKDAAARAILDTFGNATLKDVALTIADGGEGLVTADQVYDYVAQQIGAVGDILNLLSEDDHTEVSEPAAGDFVVESDGSEWLYDGTAWREVGSENAYVLKTFEIAGIDMADDITKAELQAALELGALAYKDSGSVKVTTIDSFNSFTTGAAGEYSVSSTPVSVPATYSALDVTPAGSVELTAGTAAAASYDKTTSVAISAAAPVEGTSVANYTPAGSITVTDVTVTPSSASVATVTDAGTAYQLQAGSMTQGADTTSAFATEGYVVSVGTDASGSGGADESETLIFTVASTSNAVTASGTVTYVDPQLSGSLPTFGSQSVVTGISSASATASFSGEGTVLSAAPAYTSTAATMTQPTFTAAFEGTSKSVTPAVATTVQAAGTDGSITVTSETITPSAVSTEKTVSVTFA